MSLLPNKLTPDTKPSTQYSSACVRPVARSAVHDPHDSSFTSSLLTGAFLSFTAHTCTVAHINIATEIAAPRTFMALSFAV